MSQVGHPRCKALDPRQSGSLVQCRKRAVPGASFCRCHLKLGLGSKQGFAVTKLPRLVADADDD